MHILHRRSNRNKRKIVVFTTFNKISAFWRFLALLCDDVSMTYFCRAVGTEDDMAADMWDDVAYDMVEGR